MQVLIGGLLAGLIAAGVIVIVASFRPAPLRATRRVGPPVVVENRLLAWLAAQVVVSLLVLLVSGWPALGLGVGALVWVGRLWMTASAERRNHHQVTEAIAVWVDMVKDALTGGAGLSQAIETTTAVAPEAIRPAVVRLASRQRTGNQADALREFGATLAHPTSDLVVLALISASENQARDLPRLLAKTAEQARLRSQNTLQIETERAKLYTEARTMALAIAVLGVIIAIIARDFLVPYSTVTGQLVLGLLMLIAVGSAALLVQAGRPQPEPRLLVIEQGGP